MRRWTIKELEEVDDLAFAIAVLRERQSMLTNPNAPLSQRIDTAIAGLERIGGKQRTEVARTPVHGREVVILQHRIVYWYRRDQEMTESDFEHIEELIRDGYNQGESNDDGNRGWWEIAT